MRTLLCAVMALGLVAVGCGNNECEDALDKLEECGVDLGDQKPSDDEVSDCNADAECGAKCFNAASCDEIKSGAQKLTDCLTACSK